MPTGGKSYGRPPAGIRSTRRKPIGENVGKKPPGGVDYRGRGRGKSGVWKDSRGRTIATARAEDTAPKSVNRIRNRGRNRAT